MKSWKGLKKKTEIKEYDTGENIYASIAKSRENWRRTTFTLTIAVVVLSLALAKASETNKIKTYIVEKDGTNTKVLGSTLDMSNIENKISDNEVIYFIKEVLLNTKTLPASQVMYEKNYKKSLAFLSRSASKKLDAYLKVEKYVEKAKSKKTVDIIFNTGTKLPGTKNIYQIRWKQLTYDRDGNVIEDKNYNGNFTVEFKEIENEKMLYENPLGLIITDISQREENF